MQLPVNSSVSEPSCLTWMSRAVAHLMKQKKGILRRYADMESQEPREGRLNADVYLHWKRKNEDLEKAQYKSVAKKAEIARLDRLIAECDNHAQRMRRIDNTLHDIADYSVGYTEFGVAVDLTGVADTRREEEYAGDNPKEGTRELLEHEPSWYSTLM